MCVRAVTSLMNKQAKPQLSASRSGANVDAVQAAPQQKRDAQQEHDRGEDAMVAMQEGECLLTRSRWLCGGSFGRQIVLGRHLWALVRRLDRWSDHVKAGWLRRVSSVGSVSSVSSLDG